MLLKSVVVKISTGSITSLWVQIPVLPPNWLSVLGKWVLPLSDFNFLIHKVSYSTYCKGELGGLKNIFPIKQLAKRVAHRKHVANQGPIIIQASARMTSFTAGKHRPLSALRRCGNDPWFLYL